MADSDTSGAGSESDKLQADIEKTRADLADTVDALASRVSHQKEQAKTGLVRAGIVVGAVVAVVVVVRVVKARRS